MRYEIQLSYNSKRDLGLKGKNVNYKKMKNDVNRSRHGKDFTSILKKYNHDSISSCK